VAKVGGNLTAVPVAQDSGRLKPELQRRRWGLVVCGVVLTLLHQDFWLWDDRGLVLGFLPSGLAYHMVYSLAAAAFWVACIRWAWPERWERWADEEADEPK